MLSFRRRRLQNGLPFYVVRELTDREWGSSVRINMWNGFAASIEGSDFLLLRGYSESSIRVADMAARCLTPGVEVCCDLASSVDWHTVSTPSINYLGSLARVVAPRTLIAIVPIGMFKQMGLKLQRYDRRVDIFSSIIVKAEAKTNTYSRIQLIHQPVSPIDEFNDRFTSGKLH